MNLLFRNAAILVLSGLVAVMALHYGSLRLRRGRKGLPTQGIRRYNRWERFLHLGLLASFLLAAVTGFWAGLVRGAALGGYVLLVHIAAGVAFCPCLAAMALTWAEANRLDLSPADQGDPGRLGLSEKLCFWGIALSGLVTVAATMFSMTRLPGSDGLRILSEVHRYGALSLLSVVLVHAYFASVVKPGRFNLLLARKGAPGPSDGPPQHRVDGKERTRR